VHTAQPAERGSENRVSNDRGGISKHFHHVSEKFPKRGGTKSETKRKELIRIPHERPLADNRVSLKKFKKLLPRRKGTTQRD